MSSQIRLSQQYQVSYQLVIHLCFSTRAAIGLSEGESLSSCVIKLRAAKNKTIQQRPQKHNGCEIRDQRGKKLHVATPDQCPIKSQSQTDQTLGRHADLEGSKILLFRLASPIPTYSVPAARVIATPPSQVVAKDNKLGLKADSAFSTNLERQRVEEHAKQNHAKAPEIYSKGMARICHDLWCSKNWRPNKSLAVLKPAGAAFTHTERQMCEASRTLSQSCERHNDQLKLNQH